MSDARSADLAAASPVVRPTVSSVIEQLRLSRAHLNILIIAALGVAFDSFDTYIVSYAMPSITAEWKLDPVTTGIPTIDYFISARDAARSGHPRVREVAGAVREELRDATVKNVLAEAKARRDKEQSGQ